MVVKWYKALRYSWDGLKAAFASESAFRQEVALAAAALPAALWLGENAAERALLIVSVFVVLIAELVNTAIETVVERISPEQHPLSKKAKDIGSAAVLLALVQMAAVWGLVVWG